MVNWGTSERMLLWQDVNHGRAQRGRRSQNRGPRYCREGRPSSRKAVGSNSLLVSVALTSDPSIGFPRGQAIGFLGRRELLAKCSPHFAYSTSVLAFELTKLGRQLAAWAVQ